MWPAVWAGTSITIASTGPSETLSPSRTCRSSVGIRAASAAGPVTRQPVAALISALPPVWSGCQWVFQIWVIVQPRASASASTGVASARRAEDEVVDLGGTAVDRHVGLVCDLDVGQAVQPDTDGCRRFGHRLDVLGEVTEVGVDPEVVMDRDRRVDRLEVDLHGVRPAAVDAPTHLLPGADLVCCVRDSQGHRLAEDLHLIGTRLQDCMLEREIRQPRRSGGRAG